MLCIVTYDEVVRRREANHISAITYKNGVVETMNLVGSRTSLLHVGAIGAEAELDTEIRFEENIYLTGMRPFCRMFEVGKNRDRSNYSQPNSCIRSTGDIGFSAQTRQNIALET